MAKATTQAAQLIVTGLMLVGLPLVGMALSGRDIDAYLTFPPLTRQVDHAPFSWWMFGIYAAVDALLLVLLSYLLLRAQVARRFRKTRTKHKMPPWGWLGLMVLVAGWWLAWTRFDWFAPMQGHTFCLPWIGYVLFVNALCIRRGGRSLLTDNPAGFSLLIIASALFWWFFEYLNRFVENWYYVGVDDFGPISYTIFASLAFATVLPAVLSTYRLLLTFPVFDEGLADLAPIRWPRPRLTAGVTLIAAGTGLALIGRFPDILFALLWVSPLLIITAQQRLSGERTIFFPLCMGDWRPIIVAPLAGLLCGFFWELWNIGSLARWEYAVPYVDRYHLFAMPILGYGGYLPFGLECLVFGRIILGLETLSIRIGNTN